MKPCIFILILLLFVFSCGATEDKTEEKDERETLEEPDKEPKPEKPKYVYVHDPQFDKGLALFRANCAACHKAEPYNHRMTGAGLANISDKYEQQWLIDYINGRKR